MSNRKTMPHLKAKPEKEFINLTGCGMGLFLLMLGRGFYTMADVNDGLSCILADQIYGRSDFFPASANIFSK